MAIKRDRYDKAVSDYVRSRDGWTCRKCKKYYPEGHRQGLHCSHLFGRRSQSTRYDPDNCFAHCFSCHQHLGGNPVEFYHWAVGQLGEEGVESLLKLSRQPKKWTKEEKEEHRKWLIKETERMEEENIDPEAYLRRLREAGM